MMEGGVMASSSRDHDIEKQPQREPSTTAPPRAAIGRFPESMETLDGKDHDSLNTAPYIGRLGANGTGAITRFDGDQKLLLAAPDAAPFMTLAEQFDMRPFMTWDLWRAAVTEGFGCVLLVWVTVYAAASPNVLPAPPSERFGIFDNAAFLGPLVGAFLNLIFLTLFIYSLGAVSGAHVNPAVTIATLFARLSSFPRTVLYVAFQTGGGALGGLLARVSIGTRDFKVGGCFIFTEYVPENQAFATEFMATLLVLFFAFGVGIDPRQRLVVGPTLGPWLVGLALAAVGLATGFARYGYGGASMNPARCFGAFVGASFPTYHWIHW
jgi:glycerol uptake facilitator-like aquaporin